MNKMLNATLLWAFLLVALPVKSAFCEDSQPILVHLILAGRDPLKGLAANASQIKLGVKAAGSAKTALQSVNELAQKDQAQAFEVFEALSKSSQLGADLSYAASSSLKALNYYAVDIQIPLSVFKTVDGASLFFGLVGSASELVAEVSKEKKDAQKIILSSLNTVLGGAKFASVVTGFTLPGGAIVITAAPLVAGALFKYTPKAYHYYFTSFLNAESLKAIPKEGFDSLSTYTYVQCNYNGETYWAKDMDESQSPGILSKPSATGGQPWEHKVVDFKLRGAWLSSADKSQSGFSTQNSARAILNACKLPQLVKERKIKSGRSTEVRKLYKAMADDGFTFQARDFGLIGKPHPIIFIGQISKQVLSTEPKSAN